MVFSAFHTSSRILAACSCDVLSLMWGPHGLISLEGVIRTAALGSNCSLGINSRYLGRNETKIGEL